MVRSLFAALLLIMFFSINHSFAGQANHSEHIDNIDKSQADYLSPVNTYKAIHSCLSAGDLAWCDETMTIESLQKDIELFKRAGIDRTKIIDLQKGLKESFILDEFVFRDTVVLLVEDHGYDESINIMPLTFMQENGKWKMTNKYSSDEELNSFLYHIPPLFDGKGQKPADANSFLGYEQPTQAQTELPAGTATYTVHVYFGKTINPTTFTAELNKKDISQKFLPKPLSDEEVDIPLQKGRNVLVLSAEGIRKDGRKATDTDRLVFILP